MSQFRLQVKDAWPKSFHFLIAFTIALLPRFASSMETKIIEDTLILSGPVIQGDIQRFENSIASNSNIKTCLLYTSPSPRDRQKSRMPSSA